MKAMLFFVAAWLVVACADDGAPAPSASGGQSGTNTAAGGSHAGAGGTAQAGSGGSGGNAGTTGDAEGGVMDAADVSDASATDEVSLDRSEPPDTAPSDVANESPVPDAVGMGDAPGDGSYRDASEAGASPAICAEVCSTDDDCARDVGVQALRCHPATHHCSTCLEDITCIAARSLWTAKVCTADFDCVNEGGFSPFGDVCIDIAGTGYCAFLATNTTQCTSFLNTPMFSTFEVKKLGSNERVNVCGKPSRCDADRGACQNPCTSNTSCTPARGGKVCNTGSGRCECAGDGDCGPGAPVCNLALRQCECGSQADCSTDTGRTLTCQAR
jgi:hypothetical protein